MQYEEIPDEVETANLFSKTVPPTKCVIRNKRTGEIGEFRYLQSDYVAPLVLTTYENDKPMMYRYNSLAELNEEWEDYEEPKEWWYIDIHGPHKVTNNDEYYQQVKVASKEIGNYFETREEAEKAVEKLKAWKRLKDKGFRFENNSLDICCHTINFKVDRQFDMTDETSRDLHLLFRGEE